MLCNKYQYFEPYRSINSCCAKKFKRDHPESSQPTETRDMCCQATPQGYKSPHEDSESITKRVESADGTHINSARHVEKIVRRSSNHSLTKQYEINKMQSDKVFKKYFVYYQSESSWKYKTRLKKNTNFLILLLKSVNVFKILYFVVQLGLQDEGCNYCSYHKSVHTYTLHARGEWNAIAICLNPRPSEINQGILLTLIMFVNSLFLFLLQLHLYCDFERITTKKTIIKGTCWKGFLND